MRRLTHETTVAILDRVRGGARVQDACKALGTPHKTLYSAVRADPDVRLALDDALKTARYVARRVGYVAATAQRRANGQGPRPLPARLIHPCCECGLACDIRAGRCFKCRWHRLNDHAGVRCTLSSCGVVGRRIGDHRVCGGGCPRCESSSPDGCGLLVGPGHYLERLRADGLCDECARFRDARQQRMEVSA